jgi:hypothetical protein
LKLTKQPVRACGVCHISPHSKPMMAMIATSVGKRDAETCGACHQAEHKSFLSPVATMTAQQHVATGFKLEPPHDKAKCVDCHKQMGTRKPLEKGPTLAVQFAAFFPSRSAQSCESCHTDPHRGQFANGPTHGACIACHAPTHFVPGDYDLDAHDKTAFPLTGAHRAIACASCHKKQGAAVQFVATATSCQACHADIHGGRFDQRGMLATVDGRSGCARCHTTASYTKIAWTGPDHATWTGYVLNGAHATASCTACHKPLANPDARGHLWGAAPKACASCHVDVHAGQFARQNVTDCARCHSDKGKFTETSFDHQRDSVFKLDADHMKLACAACHRPTQVAANLTIIRYRPLGTRCEDCHDSRGLGARRAP